MQQSTAALYDLVEDPSVFIKQDWNAYTRADHEVWGLLYERRLFHSAFATADQTEGMNAFSEKRPPNFTHS